MDNPDRSKGPTAAKSAAAERADRQPSTAAQRRAASPDASEEPRSAGRDRAAANGEAEVAAAPTSDEASEPEQPSDPNAAASLAALPPQFAGLVDNLAAGELGDEAPAEDGLLLGGARKSGMSALQRLLGEAAERAQLNAGSGKAGTAFDDGTAGKPRKPEMLQTAGVASLAQSRLSIGSAGDAMAGAAAQVEPGAQMPGLAPAIRAEAAAPTQLPIRTPAGQRAWAEDVGSKVMWMVGRNESKAELVLTPPHLGKLEVSINLNGDQSTAHFVAASAAARDALEQAMPRLRELLQQAGINLGQTNVSTSGEHRPGQDASAQRAGQRRGFGTAGTETDAVGGSAAATGWTRLGSGMVDIFA